MNNAFEYLSLVDVSLPYIVYILTDNFELTIEQKKEKKWILICKTKIYSAIHVNRLFNCFVDICSHESCRICNCINKKINFNMNQQSSVYIQVYQT